MQLIKAILIETIHNDHNPDFTDAEREQAHQLGIEAMKRVMACRPMDVYERAFLLPGETKD